MKKILILFIVLSFFIGGFLPANKVEASSNQLIIIDKSTNKLAFFSGGELVRTFSVGTGRTNSLTPEGTFRIVNKIKNRPYYTGGIPGGDPRNPLGDRWLGLDARGTYGTTYAIHGNSNPSSIGKYVSSGCIRMHNDEVRWLFDRVNIGTNVIIGQFNKNLEDVAASRGYKFNSAIEVFINNQALALNQSPRLTDGRVLVPLRSIFSALGATVQWDGTTRTVTAYKDGSQASLRVGSRQATVNGAAVTLDVPAQVFNGETFVPIRFVSESLGATINWDQKNRQIRITQAAAKPVAPTPPPAPIVVEVDLMINGTLNPFEQKGFVESGTTLVPFRGIFQELGASVTWDQATRTITALKGETTLQLTIDQPVAVVNGESVPLEVAPRVVSGTTFVPVRFVSEALGANIGWDQTKRLVEIRL